MNKLTVLIVGYRQGALTSNAVASFVKFCPDDLDLDFVVVENSEDKSYIPLLAHPKHNVRFHLNRPANNILRKGNAKERVNAGSYANASGIELVKSNIQKEYTFICHSDVCVTSPAFFEALREKVHEGNQLVGCEVWPVRNNPLHICGLLVQTKILKDVEVWPDMPILDVGDRLTEHAQKNNIPHCCLPFTVKRGVTYTICPKTEEVIYMHLGRGTLKLLQYAKERAGLLSGSEYYYKKKNKATYEEWFALCKDYANLEYSIYRG